MKTNWEKIWVCKKCKSTKIKVGDPSFCTKCGQLGFQVVLRRYDISWFKIKKEYMKYSNWDNPFEYRK